jgi:ubiquinone/menaquinone biosynthesis C-methylase UbiE
MNKTSVFRFLPSPLRRWLRQVRSVSEEYAIIDYDTATQLPCGWLDPATARRQHSAFVPLLEHMRNGHPRADFAALAAAVEATGLDEPLLVEVGCGSGWNSEVLTHLLQRTVRYVGVDYAFAMAALACQQYPQARFVVGEAPRLPLRDGGCEILVLGTVLMHVLGYRDAIRESRRVTRQWCILHTVPILRRRATTLLSKRAYDQPTVEIIFNEGELKQLLQDTGLAVRNTFESIPYNLESVLGESTTTRTYLCEVT